MKRSFGFAAGPTSRPAREPDLSTTEGLARHSLEHGELATLTAVAERGVRPSAPKQSVTAIGLENGARIVRLTKDVPRDPRTRRQLEADERIRAKLGMQQWTAMLELIGDIVGADRAEEVAHMLGQDAVRVMAKSDKRAAMAALIEQQLTGETDHEGTEAIEP